MYGGPAVFTTDELHAKARRLYPPGGSVDGTPSYELFVRGPLAAVTLAFESALRLGPSPEPRIHEEVTMSVFFGPLVFFGVIGPDFAEIKDFDNDPGYWELVGADPSD